MFLKTYLAENDITVRDFAKKLDCNPSYLSLIVHGRKIPGKRLAKDIEKATDHFVTYIDLELKAQRRFEKTKSLMRHDVSASQCQ